MRIVILLFTLGVLFSCSGSLSDDQRKALQEEKSSREIRKISEDEIYSKVLETGREIMTAMDEGAVLSQVEEDYKAIVVRINDETSSLSELESTIWETYKTNDWSQATAQDNVQKDGNLYFIYTSPVIGGDEDSVFLSGLWVIRLERKNVVLSL